MTESVPMFPRVNILGVHVSAINMDMALDAVAGWIRRREPHYVCVTPIHVVMDCLRQPSLRAVTNRSGLTTPDGMGIVWLLKIGGHRQVSRVYGPDLMLEVCRKSVANGWRHFFYGGGPGVADALIDRLRARFPGLAVAGRYAPPFRSLTAEEDREVRAMIRESGADIVWVGISSPKQEQWMAEHAGAVGAPVLIGVGAAFDFLSGRKRQAPVWIQRSGLEWLFRLATEPGRLWRRYAQYPLFAVLIALQGLGITRYD